MSEKAIYASMAGIIGACLYVLVAGQPDRIDDAVNAALDGRLACKRAQTYDSHMAEAICRWADDFEDKADRLIGYTSNELTLHNYRTLKKL